MEKIERRQTKEIRRTEMQEAILSTIETAGALGIALIAPQVLGALSKLGMLPSLRKNETVKSSSSRLRKRGLIKFENGYYSLTNGGVSILRRWQMADYHIVKPKRWDHKWRIIIFDIPEKKKKARDRIRQIFKSAGFIRLQDSVWVYPYDCEDVVGLLKTELGVGKNILYIIADRIEDDKYLRQDFDLL